MLDAKLAADVITLSRVMLSALVAWLGLVRGLEALPWVVWIAIAEFTSDSIDGRLARRSRNPRHTWIGDNDLLVDVLFSVGLLIYIMAAGLVDIWLGLVYFTGWGLVFLLGGGIKRAFGLLFQTFIYAYFLFIACWLPPNTGWWIVAWLVVAMVVTWPYFLVHVVPDFFLALKAIRKK